MNIFGKRIVQTRGIDAARNESQEFDKEILDALTRFSNADWGDMCKEDKLANKAALYDAVEDRLFAVYNTSKGKIYIITEHDESATTVLFADEY